MTSRPATAVRTGLQEGGGSPLIAVKIVKKTARESEFDAKLTPLRS